MVASNIDKFTDFMICQSSNVTKWRLLLAYGHVCSFSHFCVSVLSPLLRSKCVSFPKFLGVEVLVPPCS